MHLIMFFCLSFDLVFDATCDLLEARSQALVVWIVKQGVLLASVMGPPCETWDIWNIVSASNALLATVFSAAACHFLFPCRHCLGAPLAEPNETCLASSWRLKILRLSCPQVHDVLQSRYDAISMKPAGLFSVHMPTLEFQFSKYAECCTWGKNEA